MLLMHASHTHRPEEEGEDEILVLLLVEKPCKHSQHRQLLKVRKKGWSISLHMNLTFSFRSVVLAFNLHGNQKHPDYDMTL